MRRIALTLFLLFATSTVLFGQCKDILRAQSPSLIGFSLCPVEEKAMPSKGDTLVIETGGGQIVTRVTESSLTLGTQVGNVEVVEPARAQENMLLLLGVDTATVKYLSESFEVAVQNELGVRNAYHYQWSVGPATMGEDDEESEGDGEAPETAIVTQPDEGGGEDEQSSGAFRFRYTGEYARGGIFGKMKKKALQTNASLSIDTTDQDSLDFIDNNRASLGVRFTNLSLGRVWMHGQVGVETRLEKALHQDTRNVDAVVTVSGWVPVFRSFTLFSKEGEFISAPLSFKASYGYRDRDQAGESVRGRVFEGTALYHLYLLDKFQLSLNATLTHNDLNNASASIPRTQRLYKATIAYLEDPASGFKVLTSFEDGSTGVMLRKVRQYFIGVALSKLNFNGSGGS